MGARVLAREALVVFFALLVAVQLSAVDRDAVLAVGGALALVCLLVAALLPRRRPSRVPGRQPAGMGADRLAQGSREGGRLR